MTRAQGSGELLLHHNYLSGDNVSALLRFSQQSLQRDVLPSNRADGRVNAPVRSLILAQIVGWYTSVSIRKLCF